MARTKMEKRKQRELGGFKMFWKLTSWELEMDWVGGWVEEGPARDMQVSGLSTWWVTVPFPEMGNLQTGGAGVGIRFGAR